jgi:branched-chain amino acid transport system substrate-binding protein
MAALGAQARAGLMAALEELPPGERPRLVFEDDGGAAVATTAAYDSLVDQGATVVIGPLDTDCALAASVVSRRRRVPFLSPSASGDEVTRNNAYALRFCAGDAEMASELAVHARYALRLSRLAVIVDLSDRHALGFAESFSREFSVRRGRVVGELTFHPGDLDQATLLDRAAQWDVEGVLIMASHDDVLTMLEGARTPAADHLVLLGATDWEGPDLEAALVARAGGAWRVSHYHPDEALGAGDGAAALADFVAEYEKLHGEPPSDIAALTYDAARAVLSVFDPGLDGSEMAEQLRGIQYFVGITGTVHMDAGGRPRGKTFVLEQLRDPDRSAFFQRLGD